MERYFAEHEFTAKFLLSSSDCDPYPLQKIIDSASENELEQWNSIKLGYTPSEGSLFLREAIQKLYSKASAENILVSSPGELNFLAMNVLLEPSDHVITVSPCYQSLSDVVKAIGCELSYWRCN